MKKILWLLPLLTLVLAGCDDKGHPTTDLEVIVMGVVLTVAIIVGGVVFVFMIKDD